MNMTQSLIMRDLVCGTFSLGDIGKPGVLATKGRTLNAMKPLNKNGLIRFVQQTDSPFHLVYAVLPRDVKDFQANGFKQIHIEDIA